MEQARQQLLDMPWPEPETVTKGVTSLHNADTHQDHFNRYSGTSRPQLYLHRCRLENAHGPTPTRWLDVRVPFSKPWQTL